MQEDISTKSLSELKALAYDQIALKERAESNLRTLNNEISARFNAQENPPVDPPVDAALPAAPVNPETPTNQGTSDVISENPTE